jgi:hypothetical protein
MSLLNFDARNVQPAADMAPIPAGEYPAMIVDSLMKETKDKNGQYLELTHEVIDGPFKGRKVWARLNLVNRNATTVQIAQQQLSSICHAVGRLTVQDSSELHNVPMLIRVEFKAANPADPKSKDGNDIKAWKPLSGPVTLPAAAAAPVTYPPAGMPAPTHAPAAAAAPPWARPAA